MHHLVISRILKKSVLKTITSAPRGEIHRYHAIGCNPLFKFSIVKQHLPCSRQFTLKCLAVLLGYSSCFSHADNSAGDMFSLKAVGTLTGSGTGLGGEESYSIVRIARGLSSFMGSWFSPSTSGQMLLNIVTFICTRHHRLKLKRADGRRVSKIHAAAAATACTSPLQHIYMLHG